MVVETPSDNSPETLPSSAVEVLFGLGNEGGDLFRVGEQDSALRSKRDAVAGAIEEADAEIVFEGFDLKCDGGLGEEKMFGGFAEVQLFGDGAEDFQAEVLELGHGMIMHGKRWRRD